jgi:hypothetical protein
MNTGSTVFSQLMELLPLRKFHVCVERYQGNYKVKSFSCLDQFLCMVFAQLTYRESLRDIEACLRSMENRLYHMGFRSVVSRNTLANANNTRPWRIFADFGQELITEARQLYATESFGVDLQNTVYAFDSTTIDLCLSLFPWASYCQKQAGVRVHTLLDFRGEIPAFVTITDARTHDVIMLDAIMFERGAFYVMDRGYIDFTRLFTIHQSSAFFIVRAKTNILIRRLYSQPVNHCTNATCDQIIVLCGKKTPDYYPEKLRRIVAKDIEKGSRVVLFTNNFILDADVIAALYSQRWRIEIFFRWIKQHLRIKKFFGTSENAVKTQIWIAITAYVMVAIARKKLNLQRDLYTILQILSVTAFEKVSLYELFTNFECKNEINDFHNQLMLFE